MSDFKAKVHKIQFRLGLCQKSRAYSAPQLDLRCLLLGEGRGMDREWEGKGELNGWGEERKGREKGRGGR